MAPKARQGKEKATTTRKDKKRSRKDQGESSSAHLPRRMFGIKWVLEEGAKAWYSSNKEKKYVHVDLINKETLAKKEPQMLAKIMALKLDFIFRDMGECNLDLTREFYANWSPNTTGNEVKIRGQVLQLTADWINSFLGLPSVDTAPYKELYSRPPYRAIRHTLCGSRSMARWGRHKETGRHNTFPYAPLNREARIWMRIVNSCLIPGTQYTKISRDRVCLVYSLMTNVPINFGAIIRSTMRKARLHSRSYFTFGNLLTAMLRKEDIEEEPADHKLPHTPKKVDLTKVKDAETTHGVNLTTAERHARDESFFRHLYGMTRFTMMSGGRIPTAEELQQLDHDYPMNRHAREMCGVGVYFEEPLDDDVPTDDDRRLPDSDAEENSDDDSYDDSNEGGMTLRKSPTNQVLRLYFPLRAVSSLSVGCRQNLHAIFVCLLVYFVLFILF